MKKVLFCFQQVGGASALLPVIEQWRNRYDVIITGRDLVSDDLKQRGIAVSTYKDLGIDQNSISTAPAWFENISPDIVITDTIDLARTSDGIACRDFWRLAARYGIPSIAYVDCWWGYDKRFRLPEEGSPLILPDYIAVVDKLAEKDIIAAGFPPDKIVVLGSPKFEYLSSFGAMQNKHRFGERAGMGLNREKFLILFISQPLEKTFGSSSPYGFTEKTTLSALVSTLEKFPQNITDNISLIVLLHPEESEEILNGVIETKSRRFDIEIRKLQEPYGLLMSANLVIGMSSIMLAEAVIMKIPVLSVQLDLKQEEILVTNIIGATLSIKDFDHLYDKLFMSIVDDNFRADLIQRQAIFEITIDSSTLWTKFVDNLFPENL